MGIRQKQLTESLIDHGSISGLSDDDHTQYLLIDGSRAMTGSLNLNGNTITNVGTFLGRNVTNSYFDISGDPTAGNGTAFITLFGSTNAGTPAEVRINGTTIVLNNGLVRNIKLSNSLIELGTAAANYNITMTKTASVARTLTIQGQNAVVSSGSNAGPLILKEGEGDGAGSDSFIALEQASTSNRLIQDISALTVNRTITWPNNDVDIGALTTNVGDFLADGSIPMAGDLDLGGNTLDMNGTLELQSVANFLILRPVFDFNNNTVFKIDASTGDLPFIDFSVNNATQYSMNYDLANLRFVMGGSAGGSRDFRINTPSLEVRGQSAIEINGLSSGVNVFDFPIVGVDGNVTNKTGGNIILKPGAKNTTGDDGKVSFQKGTGTDTLLHDIDLISANRTVTWPNTDVDIGALGIGDFLADGSVAMTGDLQLGLNTAFTIKRTDSTSGAGSVTTIQGQNALNSSFGVGGDLNFVSGDTDNGPFAGAINFDSGVGGDNEINIGTTRASKINISKSGKKIGFFGATAIVKQTITGSRGGNAALADFLTKMASFGLIIDSTT